jgi:arylsulfatase A-like enzyme
MASGLISEAVNSIDIAPTLGEKLGLDLPAGLDGRVLNLGKLDGN